MCSVCKRDRQPKVLSRSQMGMMTMGSPAVVTLREEGHDVLDCSLAQAISAQDVATIFERHPPGDPIPPEALPAVHAAAHWLWAQREPTVGDKTLSEDDVVALHISVVAEGATAGLEHVDCDGLDEAAAQAKRQTECVPFQLRIKNGAVIEVADVPGLDAQALGVEMNQWAQSNRITEALLDVELRSGVANVRDLLSINGRDLGAMIPRQRWQILGDMRWRQASDFPRAERSRMNLVPLSTEHLAEQTEMQTLIFSKERFEKREDAIAWAKDNGFKATKVDETSTSWRLRQREPGEFTRGSFRTIKLSDGITGVIGRLSEDLQEQDALAKAMDGMQKQTGSGGAPLLTQERFVVRKSGDRYNVHDTTNEDRIVFWSLSAETARGEAEKRNAATD